MTERMDVRAAVGVVALVVFAPAFVARDPVRAQSEDGRRYD